MEFPQTRSNNEMKEKQKKKTGTKVLKSPFRRKKSWTAAWVENRNKYQFQAKYNGLHAQDEIEVPVILNVTPEFWVQGVNRLHVVFSRTAATRSY